MGVWEDGSTQQDRTMNASDLVDSAALKAGMMIALWAFILFIVFLVSCIAIAHQEKTQANTVVLKLLSGSARQGISLLWYSVLFLLSGFIILSTFGSALWNLLR